MVYHIVIVSHTSSKSSIFFIFCAKFHQAPFKCLVGLELEPASEDDSGGCATHLGLKGQSLLDKVDDEVGEVDFSDIGGNVKGDFLILVHDRTSLSSLATALVLK